MTYPMPTDTVHVRIESRQYRVFKMDLGEGIPRSWLKVGALIYAPWLLLCNVLGVPFVGGFALWVAPPGALTWWLMSRDAGGRLRIRGIVDLLRWYLDKPGPIVNGDTASPRPVGEVSTDLAFLITSDPQVTTAEDLDRLNVPLRPDFTRLALARAREEASRAQAV